MGMLLADEAYLHTYRKKNVLLWKIHYYNMCKSQRFGASTKSSIRLGVQYLGVCFDSTLDG